MTDPVAVVSQKTLPSASLSYSASAITLYGIPLLGFDVLMGAIPYQASITTWPSTSATGPPWFPPGSPPGATVPLEVALIYGFAYQGHCYDLPEPMAVVVDLSQGPRQPAVGCGYGGSGTPGDLPTQGVAVGRAFSQGAPYYMWQVDKLDRTVLIQTTNDTFEEVMLKRNLIGAKQPLSYRSANQISHRGGKLTEFE